MVIQLTPSRIRLIDETLHTRISNGDTSEERPFLASSQLPERAFVERAFHQVLSPGRSKHGELLGMHRLN